LGQTQRANGYGILALGSVGGIQKNVYDTAQFFMDNSVAYAADWNKSSAAQLSVSGLNIRIRNQTRIFIGQTCVLNNIESNSYLVIPATPTPIFTVVPPLIQAVPPGGTPSFRGMPMSKSGNPVIINLTSFFQPPDNVLLTPTPPAPYPATPAP
jgi:hypothetical protein